MNRLSSSRSKPGNPAIMALREATANLPAILER